MWKGSKTGLERDKKRVGTGKKTGWNGGRNWFLNGKKKRNLPKFYNLERRGTAVLRRSTSFHRFFSPFQPFFHPFLTIFAKNGKKKVVKKWRNGKGKNAFLSSFFPVPVFSRSFPRTSLVEAIKKPRRVMEDRPITRKGYVTLCTLPLRVMG